MSRIHDASFQLRARPIRKAAYADRTTRCWRCGLTLAEAEAVEGRPVRWHAGHTVTGDPYSPLMAEHSTCNLRDAQAITTSKRRSSGGTQRF